jgi:hypothetical protein
MGEWDKKELRELVYEDVKWIHLAQGRDCYQAVVNMVLNLTVLAPMELVNT